MQAERHWANEPFLPDLACRNQQFAFSAQSEAHPLAYPIARPRAEGILLLYCCLLRSGSISSLIIFEFNVCSRNLEAYKKDERIQDE